MSTVRLLTGTEEWRRLLLLCMLPKEVKVSSDLKTHLIGHPDKIEVFLANKKGHWLVRRVGIYC